MISLSHVSVCRGAKPLIQDASLQIHPKFKVGVTGNNGTGKSSLFAVLQKTLGLDAGELTMPDAWVVAHMAQEVLADDMSALDFVLSGDAEWFELNEKITQAANLESANVAEQASRQSCVSQSATPPSAAQIAQWHSRFDDIDGFTAAARAAKLLTGLGFVEADHARAVGTFSGGWQMRLALAKVLMCRSDLLLLDEPTNHLDLDAILWLEDWLKSYTGTLLIISHDQQFLDAVADHILHIENQNLELYTGNYTQVLSLRSEQLAQRAHEIKKQEATRAHLQRYIDRFAAKATKAKQAQSRIKQLARMQTLSPILAQRAFSFGFYEPEQTGSPLIKLTGGALGYADKPILQHIDLEIVPDSRIGLLGVNGAGKSTLVKGLVGHLPLMAGEMLASDNLKIGYFSQHNVDALDVDATPLLLLRRLAGTTSDAILRTFLGSFGFSGESIDAKVVRFSGGERARLNLALIVWQRPNLLILDEPTNHLDIQMKQALSFAIQQFAGALVLVSHDRALINSVCDVLYLVDDGTCTEFAGDITDYAQWLRNKRKNTASETAAGESSPTMRPQASREGDASKSVAAVLSKEEKRKQAALLRKQTAPLRKNIQQLETTLTNAEAALSEVEARLAEPSMYDDANKDELLALLGKQSELKQQVTDTEEVLLELMDELEVLIRELGGETV